MNMRIKGAIGSLVVTGIVIAVAVAQSPPISPYDQYADVNGDGVVNIADRGIVALNSNTGATWPANPCVPYHVVDDVDPWYTPADGGAVINSLGEFITPARGAAYYVPWTHPSYQSFLLGTPWAYGLRACP